jgi:hypothetical protein
MTRRQQETSVSMVTLAYGYLSEATYGPGWKCERGYRAAGTRCVAGQLPANAHLDYSGSSWDYAPPYRKPTKHLRTALKLKNGYDDKDDGSESFRAHDRGKFRSAVL